MSEVTTIEFDPFALTAPDEETELGALAASLRLAKSFSLLFARCNQPDQRRRLVASLRERLPKLNIQEIDFREPITHLLDELRFRIAEPAPDAIFVSGLEYSLPVAAQAANTPLTAILNISRNSFGRYIPCPLVLWVPEYVLTAIMNGAPDFFSVRSGVYFYSADPNYIHTASQPLIETEQRAVDNLPSSDKMERIHNLEQLLQDYKLLDSSRRDYNTEARLLDQLGHLYSVTDAWEEAERSYIETRHIAQQTGYLDGEATSLLNLGSVYARQGKWDAAEDCYTRSFEIRQQTNDVIGQARVLANIGNLNYVRQRFSEAITLYQESLNMLLPFGLKAVGWQSYNNIGNVYIAQEDWQKSLHFYLQALEAARQLKDKHGEAIVLSNIAGLYSGLRQWKQAENCCQQAIAIVRLTGDIGHESRILENWGQICQSQGKWNEAVKYFSSSLNIRHNLGDLVGEGHTLHSIALLYKEQGDYDKALEFAQKADSVLQKTEDKIEYASVLNTVAEIQKQKLAHEPKLV